MLCLAGLFVNSTGSLAEKFLLNKYKLDVTPDDWTFYFNALIYFWQALWLVYGIFMLFLQVPLSRHRFVYFYREFPVIPPILYVVFSFSLACNVSWLLIWDREYMEVALVFINLMTCTLYICLVVSIRRLKEFAPHMVQTGLRRHVWIMQVVCCNGLAVFATWGTVAAMFNFAVVLAYGTETDQGAGSTVALALFLLEILVWFAFDMFLFEAALRYLYTPYVVIIVSLIGILTKNYSATNSNTVIVLVILILVSLLFVVKVLLSVYRHRSRPLYLSEHKMLLLRLPRPRNVILSSARKFENNVHYAPAHERSVRLAPVAPVVRKPAGGS